MSSIETTNKLAQDIYLLACRPKKQREYNRNELFDPGRADYLWSLEDETSFVPDVVVKSRSTSLLGHQKYSLSDHDRLVLGKVSKFFERLRTGKGTSSIALKSSSKSENSVEKVAGKQQAKEREQGDEEDDDIFADAGTDYVLTVNKDRKGVSNSLFKSELEEMDIEKKKEEEASSLKRQRAEKEEKQPIEEYDQDYDYMDAEDAGLFMADTADIKAIRQWQEFKDEKQRAWEEKNPDKAPKKKRNRVKKEEND